MNEHINDISGEIVAVMVAIGGFIVGCIRKLIGMDQRIGELECEFARIESERSEARHKVESLMLDVSSIKADVRSNAANTNRILDLLERK